MIAERYRLVSLLAEGGMGAVWRAEHLELGVEVALKVLLESAHTSSAERRFRQEAQAAARLRSPHVVQVQDFGVVKGQPFLVMELLVGEDLAARIVDRGPLSPFDCAGILDGVAAAIQLAHDNGIIHRDLKPANIFLAKEGAAEVVKVLDFGIAKVDGIGKNGASTTGTGLVGSPAYMSPEQVWAETLTPATDLWSMGVVAFEMLVAQNPFDDGPLARVFQRIVTDEIPRARDLRPGLPVGLDAFFERALARDPKQRFPSSLELAAAFREACSTDGARSLPPISTTSSGARRSISESIGAAATVQVEAIHAPTTPRKAMHGAFVGAAVLVLATTATIWWSATRQHSTSDAPSSGPTATGRAEASPEPDGTYAPSAAPPASSALAEPAASAPRAPSTSAAPTGISRPKARPGSSPSSSPSGKPLPPAKASGAPSGVDPFFGIPQPTN